MTARRASSRDARAHAGLRRRSDATLASAEQVEETKRELLEFLIDGRRAGKHRRLRRARARATRSSTTAACATDFLDFTVDRNPYKQGSSSPDAHPDPCPEGIDAERPDYILILPWNLKEEIVGQLAYVREWGGRSSSRSPAPWQAGTRESSHLLRGQGLRMREASELVPKPMIPIGNRPMLWHVMKYYAHFGFIDFVLCLGYKAEAIKHFFLTYNEALANDFVLSTAARACICSRPTSTTGTSPSSTPGCTSCIGERLRAVRHLLGDDEMFLANYGDTLTDADLPAMIERTKAASVTASFLAVRPNYSFHVVSMDDGGIVDGISDVTRSDVWINGGYFVLRSEMLDQIQPGEELVEEPFSRLMQTASSWPSVTTASGRQWTRSRTSRASRRCTRTAPPHGRSGTRVVSSTTSWRSSPPANARAYC